jgi:hypothetical protein
MTLSEAMQLRDFYYKESYQKLKAWKLSGKYYYEDVLKRQRPEDMKVEIHTSRIFFWSTKWIDFTNIIPVHRFDKTDVLMDVLKS